MTAEERVSYRDELAEAVLVFFGHDRAGRNETSVRMARGIADAVLSVSNPELDRLSQENDRLRKIERRVLYLARRWQGPDFQAAYSQALFSAVRAERWPFVDEDHAPAALGQPPAEKEEDPGNVTDWCKGCGLGRAGPGSYLCADCLTEPGDAEIVTLRPGEPPTKVHTIHLPEG